MKNVPHNLRSCAPLAACCLVAAVGVWAQPLDVAPPWASGVTADQVALVAADVPVGALVESPELRPRLVAAGDQSTGLTLSLPALEATSVINGNPAQDPARLLELTVRVFASPAAARQGAGGFPVYTSDANANLQQDWQWVNGRNDLKDPRLAGGGASIRVDPWAAVVLYRQYVCSLTATAAAGQEEQVAQYARRWLDKVQKAPGGGGTDGGTGGTSPLAGSAELIICESAPGGQPQNIANEFTAPKTLTALVKYTQLPANTTVRWVWTRDNLPRAELTKVLSGTGWQSHSLTSPTALTPGRYHLSLLVNGKSAAERDVTVRAAGGGTTTTTTTTPQALATFALTGPSSVGTLAKQYDRYRFGVKLGVTWTKPGTILDTVGINAAPVGSFTILVDGTGKLHLQVYAPAAGSSYKQSNGWHVLPSPVALKAGQYGEVTLTYEKEQWELRVSASGQQQTVALSLPVPLSGEPIYVGDFPGDNNWPATLTPNRGITGTVKVINVIGRSE